MPDQGAFTNLICLRYIPDQHRATVAENLNPGFFRAVHRSALHPAVTRREEIPSAQVLTLLAVTGFDLHMGFKTQAHAGANFSFMLPSFINIS
ncbi:hypothetical protein [Pseudomonas sp. KCJK9016]|uniref:hypothetical protein n=1 Tax=Pseudomonas sp. KCJK9016 TaxID=3344556 RepID=UPI003905BDE8